MRKKYNGFVKLQHYIRGGSISANQNHEMIGMYLEGRYDEHSIPDGTIVEFTGLRRGQPDFGLYPVGKQSTVIDYADSDHKNGHSAIYRIVRWGYA